MRLLRIARVAPLMLLLPCAAMAQGWSLRTGDDSSFFTGAIHAPEGIEMMLLCGERSPQGVSPEVTGNMEPDITPAQVLRLNLSTRDIGQPQHGAPPRADVMIVTGSTGYRLAAVRWNEMFGVWEADLAANDAVFAAMSAAPVVQIHSAAGVRSGSAANFGTAYQQLIQYCEAQFAAIGQPWGGPGQGGPMQEAAEAEISARCNGPARREDGYMLRANIDGDGVEDVVLDWSAISCQQGEPRSFCGAANWESSTFISASYPRTGRPVDLYSLGVSITALSNGLDGVTFAGGLSSCGGTGGCETTWYWTGAEFTPLD